MSDQELDELREEITQLSERQASLSKAFDSWSARLWAMLGTSVAALVAGGVAWGVTTQRVNQNERQVAKHEEKLESPRFDQSDFDRQISPIVREFTYKLNAIQSDVAEIKTAVSR